MLGPSQLHSSERASRPAARTAHRAQQPGEIRWDGSKKAELAGGWCWPGAGRALLFTIIFHGACQLAGLGQAVTCGEEDGYTQTIIAAAATGYNQVSNKLVG